MVPFLKLYLNSVNNTSCPRVYTLLRLCSSLCFATKGMSVVAATNVVVDTPPRNARRGKGKIYWRAVSFFTELYWPVSSSRFPFLLAGFSRAFLLVSLLDPISNLPLPVLGAVLVLPRWNILDFDADWFYQRERDREGRREERGVEIGTGLEIILILVRARNYLLGIAVIRNNDWCEIFGFFWTRKIEISTRFQDFGIF